MITAHSNSKIKYLKSLSKKKYRREHNAFYLEGNRAVTQGLLSGKKPSIIVVSETFTKSDTYKELNNICFAQGIDAKQVLLIVSDNIFASISETKTPQGIGGVFDIPKIDYKELQDAKNIVLLENLQDPGNMGTIIRTADAAGFDAIICTKGSVDSYNSKVLRSTVGSIFHIDVFQNEEESSVVVKKLKDLGYKLYCADPKGDTSSFDVEFTQRNVIVIGNEANGVSCEMLEACDVQVTIPMPGRAESLNASIAAALMIYEVVRRSDFK